DPAYAGGGTPQLASAPSPANQTPAAALTAAQLAPVVDAAIERLTASPTLPADAALLRSLPFAIDDLPALMIAQTIPNPTVIDATAAGYGWFIDPTPLNDAEFTYQTGTTELTAAGTSPAAGRMDLLTVVMHELEHVLGRADTTSANQAHDLMATWLQPGVR